MSIERVLVYGKVMAEVDSRIKQRNEGFSYDMDVGGVEQYFVCLKEEISCVIKVHKSM